MIGSLPYTDSDTTTTTAGLWYLYTPSAINPNVIGARVTSATGQGALLYSPDSSTQFSLFPSTNPSTLFNKPFQFPVSVGTAYYINVLGSSPGAYTLNVQAAPNLTAPAGSIFVNDSQSSRPLILLSAVDGSVLRFVSPFPGGENADVLTTGRILVHDRSGAQLALFGSDLSAVTTHSYSVASDKCPIRSAASGTFYVGMSADAAHGNLATVTTVTSAGAFGPTTWTLPNYGLTGIATNAAETILYYTGQGVMPPTLTSSPVSRWDLVNNVALSDLAASLGASWFTGIDTLVLADDTIVVSYMNTTAATAPVLKHYATDGTVLDTWTLTGSRSTDTRLTAALDDPASLWIRTEGGAGISRFTNLKVADGSTITTFDVHEFSNGVWLGSVPGSPARFGPAFTCPILLLRADLPALGSVTGTIDLALGADLGTGAGTSGLSVSVSGIVSPPKAGDCWRR